MISIRDFNPGDTAEVSLLIKNTYSQFNLAYLPPAEQKAFLGPFFYAGSDHPEHLRKIENVIQSQFIFVAVEDQEIIGVLRGRMGRLGSLFVAGKHQNRGAGRLLIDHFEDQVLSHGGGIIRVASSIYAVGFYQRMGYKKSTGVRKSWSFDGYGFPIQPMRKVLPHS